MGKLSKMRHCPALGRGITAAECGEQRNTRITCTAECPHNPFARANYSQLLEIEERLDVAIHELLTAQCLGDMQFQRDLAKLRSNSDEAAHAFYTWQILFARGADGATRAERWLKSGMQGVRNDERALFRAKTQTRVALLEVHRVLDGERTEAVDLFAPDSKPMILQDRGFASIAVRFATLLSWVYPLPHYWRLHGMARQVTDVAGVSALDVVQEVARHLGGPAGESELPLWLAENMARVAVSLQAVGRLRKAQLWASMDVKLGKAVYELRASFAQCRDQVDQHPDVEPDPLSAAEQNEGFAEARFWAGETSERDEQIAPGGTPSLGRALLGQAHWRLETMGAEKLSRLRSVFESHMGDLVRFTGERLDDVLADHSKTNPGDVALAPPRLLENPERMILMSHRLPVPSVDVSKEEAEAELRRAADVAFLDGAVPALDNHTPRQAASDPALRPKLVLLMKRRIRMDDEQNLRTGGDLNSNWMLRELGLDDLIFDAPPRRPPTEIAEQDIEDDEPDDLFFPPLPVDPNRPAAPPLPNRPFTFDEASRRLEVALRSFETAQEGIDEIYASGSTILDDAFELAEDWMSADEYTMLVAFLLQVWFAFVPDGCRAPDITFDDLAENFLANMRDLSDCIRDGHPEVLESLMRDSPQPDLVRVIVAQFLDTVNNAPKKIRPRVEAQPAGIAILISVVETLDAALRFRSV